MSQALEEPRPARLRAVGGRVPPHNLEAEESVLGAMLLSRDAIAAALECCTADDFYKPAHGIIFEAITSLYTRGEPADPVTVADELRRTGKMETVGDPSTLLALQVRTPSTANAAHYARIVEEHALLRRLVAVAGEIAELGYSVPEDVAEVVDRAETLVFEVAQRRVVDTLSPLRDLLAQSLDHLEHLYEREETITGVPTGYVDLDERLAGLQPSNLVVVGARPAMGKALACDTPVPTPTGWSTMGQLRPGDEVFDERGRPCTVQYVSPVFLGHRCYRLRFDDGSSLVADAGHRWLVFDRAAGAGDPDAGPVGERRSAVRLPGAVAAVGARSALRGWGVEPVPDVDVDAGGDPVEAARPRVVTTEEMVAAGTTGEDGRARWQLPVAAALEGPAEILPLDPYALGVWLAAANERGEMELRAADTPFVVAELERRGYFLVRRPGGRWVATDVAQVPSTGGGQWRSLAAELGACGLAGGQRRLPAAYRRGWSGDRWEVVRGLMDVAGRPDAEGTVELEVADAALAADAHELLSSLGQRPVWVDGAGSRGQPHRGSSAASQDAAGPEPGPSRWRLRWRPTAAAFRSPARAAATVGGDWAVGDAADDGQRRTVVAIEPVPSVPVRCIAVSSPSHLFLAGWEMVPTHNTSFALGIVTHAAITTGKPVLLFSLEMSHLELTQRILCAEARVDATRMRNGRLLDSDWPKVSDAIGRLGDAPIFIDDNPNVTVMDIRAKARRLMAREGLGLVVVDYLQLMTGRSRAESRQVEVSEISRGLKILARELNVPVVALSQLSRNLEMRQDKRPVLADLRESGSIEQDADVVLFIYRDEVYHPDSDQRGTAEVIIAKHRNGPVGTVQLAFVDHYTRFANMARV
jgi:replicative DNA helicase